jgi:hypothetical protein
MLVTCSVFIHTGVEEFPSWTSTSFSKLEYLYVHLFDRRMHALSDAAQRRFL